MQPSELSSSREVLLLVDHDPTRLEALQEMVREDYEVLFAASGVSTVEMAREEQPAVIILRADLPEMDGYEVALALKEDPLCEHIPVLMVQPEGHSPTKAFDAGCADFLPMPICVDTLLARLGHQVRIQRQRETLRRLSTLDGLTGLSNRRTFQKHLETSWRRCTRNNAPISLILIDIDDFQSYNDSNGHYQGDRCLCRVAEVVSALMNRVDDLGARYAGDTFGCLLPQTDEDGAVTKAHQLMARLQGLELGISFSLGVSTELPAAALAEDLLSSAESALSEAKRQGNTVCSNFDPSDRELSVFRKKQG